MNSAPMGYKIGVIINYCTNDYKFIRHAIRQVSGFASEIVVPVLDHFLDGEPENLPLLKRTIKENPEAEFVMLPYEPIKPPVSDFLCRLIPRSTNLRPLYGSHYWVCMARSVGYQHISDKVDYVLFLDADEIVDGQGFRQWLDTGQYNSLGAMYFSCYFYFRRPCYQATSFEECGLMIRKVDIGQKVFLSHYDRGSIYRKVPGDKKRNILGRDGLPLIHHYAWARTKEEMLQKIRTWGHRQDRDWEKLVREEFSREFNGTDFVHGYRYRTMKPRYGAFRSKVG